MQQPIKAKCYFIDQSGMKLGSWFTRVFPRLPHVLHCFFEFRLVYWISCECCDWTDQEKILLTAMIIWKCLSAVIREPLCVYFYSATAGSLISLVLV